MRGAVLFFFLIGCSSSPNVPAEAGPMDAGDAGVGVDANAPCTSDVEPSDGIVITDRGAVEGMKTTRGWAFKGVPYAAQPERWKAPVQHECWSGARPAMNFGETCIRRRPQLVGDPLTKGSEDCLTANVWTQSTTTKNPVLVYVHGDLFWGSSEQAPKGTYFDGDHWLVRNGGPPGDIVVVTINYRQGPLGFFAHPALSTESGHGSGAYGVLDILEALKWVQKNAAAFGGDPSRVVLMGQGTGARLASHVVASPLAKGLLSGAILMSGQYVKRTLADAEKAGTQAQSLLGCDGAADVLACMRQVSATDLVSGLYGKSFEPPIDGYVVQTNPLDAIAAGTHQHVPFIVGATAQEQSLYEPSGSPTQMDVQNEIDATFGSSNTSAILALYPWSDYATPRDVAVAVKTDAYWACSARRFARAATKGQGQGTFLYYWNRPIEAAKSIGSYHGVDQVFMWEAFAQVGVSETSIEHAVCDTLGRYWMRFASTGLPNGGDTYWPRYDDSSPYFQIGMLPEVFKGYLSDKCDFWDASGFGQ